MSRGLAAVQSRFSVKKGHKGFYARDMFEKPGFDPAESKTADMHACETDTPYARHENIQGKRATRRMQLPEGVRGPNVMRVVQVAGV